MPEESGNPEIDDIVNQLDLATIGEQIGVDPTEVESAARAAVPMLLGGMEVNSDDADRLNDLLGALGDHAERDPHSVDPVEGEKIARHLVGDDPDQAIRGFTGGGGDSIVKKILPFVAPIVLSMVAKKMGGKNAGALTAVLGSLIGGAAAGASPSGHKTPEGMLGGLIGSIFGKR